MVRMEIQAQVPAAVKEAARNLNISLGTRKKQPAVEESAEETIVKIKNAGSVNTFAFSS